jgi:predicted ATPase
VVITGGPGAGKTAVLEVVRRHLCQHVTVLPEAASIVFGGGFPRRDTAPARAAAQRAIYHVQDELESMVLAERRAAMALCDRGVLDGLAYWPGTPAEFFRETGTTREAALDRYGAVVHLCTPDGQNGYDHSNPLRIESAEEAARLDARIQDVWSGHPRRYVVPSTHDFLDKLALTLSVLYRELPACCRSDFGATTLSLQPT